MFCQIIDPESKRNHPLGQFSKLSIDEILCKIEIFQDCGLNVSITL